MLLASVMSLPFTFQLPLVPLVLLNATVPFLAIPITLLPIASFELLSATLSAKCSTP